MERELSVLSDLIKESYPHLPILVNVDDWMAQRFQAPVAFLLTQGVMETGSSLTSYQVVSEAAIVLHYPKVDGVYQPISIEPLRQLLRRLHFSYRGKDDDLTIELDSTSLRIWRDKRDRAEITFRFTYKATVPKDAVDKINIFDIEEVKT